MHIFILIVATLLIISWLVLLCKVSREDWIQAAYVKVFDSVAAIDKLRQKDRMTVQKLSGFSGFALFLTKLIAGGDSSKKIRKLELDIECLQKGELRSVNVIAMPGYVLQRKYEAVGKGSIHKAILSKSFELYGNKHAANKARHLLAMLLSFPMIGVSVTLMLGVVFLGMGSTLAGMGIIGIGTLLVLVLVYAMYDELNDLVQKRRNAIIRQFPNVVSKLALLVTSGMIMDRAWKETAFSQETELYQEMRKASKELDNLVSPESAYSNFINRCNTKESAKLASAIMQNLSKGNAEIGALLKDMAREAWQERRHTAKRDAEKANSKLMIPTMLLFLAILVMLMVPVAMNFTGI